MTIKEKHGKILLDVAFVNKVIGDPADRFGEWDEVELIHKLIKNPSKKAAVEMYVDWLKLYIDNGAVEGVNDYEPCEVREMIA